MLTAIKAAKFKKFRRTLLAIGTASGALGLANPAMAACVIAPGGTGTVANPGPNSTVICTGTTNGILVAGTNNDTTVHVESGALLTGVVGDEISLNGSASHVIIGGGPTPGPATVRDVSISAFGDGARISVTNGSLLDQSGNPNALIMVFGNNASIGIGAGSQVTVSRAVQVHGGTGSSLFLEAGATLSASSGFVASALIFGGLGTQNFSLEGTIEARGSSPMEVLVDATDGDDIIALNSTTRFTTGAFATLTPTYLLDGGNDYDRLYLDNIDQSLRFDTVRIEQLVVDPGAGGGLSRIYGSHEFQEILVRYGQLDVYGAAAFGAPASLVNIQNASRVRFLDSGSGLLTQRFSGTGTFDYQGGTHEFASQNFLSGEFIIGGGTPIISHSQAFGTALVTNYAEVVLRDVNIANTLGGNGNYIIDGVSSSLFGTNSMSGRVTIRRGDLVTGNVAALGNGQAFPPALIAIEANGRLTLDISNTQTLDNVLIGSGTLAKYLTGDLIINRSNSGFSGQVNLLGGRTFVNADDALGTGVIFLNATTLVAGNVIVNNQLTGTGEIVRNGTGVTQLRGNNNLFSGQITANGGSILVTSGSGLGAANVVLATGASLEANVASGSTTIANTISGGGRFIKSGGGLVNLTGTNTYSGGTDISPGTGTLRVTGSAALGTGAVAVGAGATLAFDNSGNATFTNAMSGSGTFRKSGAGLLTFGNPFSVGALAVDAGRVRINGTATTNATVASGATLDGTGRIIGNLTNNGTVAPGNSIGTLTVQGNYVHGANSVLDIEFDANGNIDLLAVTGTATLNGGTLRFVSLGGAEGSGGTFLTATGGVTGTFATVQTVGALLPLAVIYQPNSVIMAPSVLTARPSTFNAQFMAASDSAFGFIDRVAGSGQTSDSGKYVWMQGFAADGNRNAGGTTLAYEHKGHGLAGGIVLPLGERLSLGASAGWSRSKVALGSNGGSGEQDAVLGSLHLRYGSDNLAIEAGGFYGSVDQDTVRNVSFNGFSASIDGATKSKVCGGFVGGQAQLADLSGWKLSLNARASLVHQSQDDFTELATSPLRLTVADADVDTLEAQGGFGVEGKLGKVRLSLNLGARVVDSLGTREIPVSFAASNASVVLQGDTRSSVHGFGGAALELPLGEQVSITVGYAGQLGQTDRHEGRAGLQVAF